MANFPSKESAIEDAKRILQQQPLYLDTETTGLSEWDEIIEIGVIDAMGQTLFEQFVKPTQPVPPDSTRLHGITDEMIRTALPWPMVWNNLKPVLNGKTLAIYNDIFDIRMMWQSFHKYRILWKRNFRTFDVMKCYAMFRGEWNSDRQSYRLFKLSEAGASFNINVPNAHRAVLDSLLTKAVLEAIARS